MQTEQWDHFLQQLREDVESLPLPAIQLVGGLVALQAGLPEGLRDFLMAQLGKRVDMSEVSPAAEALMRISAFAPYADTEYARTAILTQQEILRAVALDDQVVVAVAFMNRLADRLMILSELPHPEQSERPGTPTSQN